MSFDCKDLTKSGQTTKLDEIWTDISRWGYVTKANFYLKMTLESGNGFRKWTAKAESPQPEAGGSCGRTRIKLLQIAL